MRRGVTRETGRTAGAIAARLQQRLILERRARRAAVGEVLAGARRPVGDDQRLIAIVVTLAGTKLIAFVEQRKERIVRSVAAPAERERQLFVNVIGTDN